MHKKLAMMICSTDVFIAKAFGAIEVLPTAHTRDPSQGYLTLKSLWTSNG